MRYDWQEMNDEDFLKKAEEQIWFSAFASNNPHAPAHEETDKAYDEAKRRGKPWLYKRAWNNAYRSCGFEPSQSDIEGAREPVGEVNAIHP